MSWVIEWPLNPSIYPWQRTWADSILAFKYMLGVEARGNPHSDKQCFPAPASRREALKGLLYPRWWELVKVPSHTGPPREFGRGSKFTQLMGTWGHPAAQQPLRTAAGLIFHHPARPLPNSRPVLTAKEGLSELFHTKKTRTPSVRGGVPSRDIWSLSTDFLFNRKQDTTASKGLNKHLAPQPENQLQQEHEGLDVRTPMVPPLDVLPHSWEMVPDEYWAAGRTSRLILPPQQLSRSPFHSLP